MNMNREIELGPHTLWVDNFSKTIKWQFPHLGLKAVDETLAHLQQTTTFRRAMDHAFLSPT